MPHSGFYPLVQVHLPYLNYSDKIITMEHFEQPTIFKFGIDDTTRQNLKGVAQWARLNALLGFISIGLSLLTIIITSIKFFFVKK